MRLSLFLLCYYDFIPLSPHFTYTTSIAVAMALDRKIRYGFFILNRRNRLGMKIQQGAASLL
jgi:hypothetical protein